MRAEPLKRKPVRTESHPEEEYWSPVVVTDIDIPFSRMVAISFTATLAMMVSGLLAIPLIIFLAVVIAAVVAAVG